LHVWYQVPGTHNESIYQATRCFFVCTNRFPKNRAAFSNEEWPSQNSIRVCPLVLVLLANKQTGLPIFSTLVTSARDF
jgi:hypothetical protein